MEPPAELGAASHELFQGQAGRGDRAQLGEELLEGRGHDERRRLLMAFDAG